MVGMLNKFGSTSGAPATLAPMTYDQTLFDLSVEKQKVWTFGDLKQFRKLPGVLGAMYSPDTPWGKVIDYAELMQQSFGLEDSDIFCNAWRDKASGEVKRSRPMLKKHENTIVLSIPRKTEPVSVPPSYKVRGWNGVLAGCLVVPFSLDLDEVSNVYGDLSDKDVESYAKGEVADQITDGNLYFVRPWTEPKAGGAYGTLKDDEIPVGLYWCDGVALKTNEGEKNGEKYKITSAKFSLTTMTDDRISANGTESNGRKIISAIGQRIPVNAETMKFADFAEVFTAEEVRFTKPFLLLLTDKQSKGNGVTVSLMSVIPTELPELVKLSPVAVKFIESHGFTSQRLYEAWNAGAVESEPVEAVNEGELSVVDEAAQKASIKTMITEIIEEKTIVLDEVKKYAKQQFGTHVRDKMTVDQLNELYDWCVAYEAPAATESTVVDSLKP